MTKSRSDVFTRRVAAYLDKETFDRITKRTVKNRSHTINQIVADYYKSLPDQEQNNLIKLWDEMTEEQRLDPRKL